MFRAQRAAYVTLAVMMDAMALVLAFLVAWQLRDSLGNFLVATGVLLHLPVQEMVRKPGDLPPFYRILLSNNPLVDIRNHLWLLYLALPSWLFFLNSQGGYDPSANRNARQTLAVGAYAGLLSMGVLLVFMFLAKFEGVSRLLTVNFLLLGILFLWFERTVLIPLIQRRGRQPVRNLLVIGSRRATEEFAAVLETPAYRWSRLLGFVSDDAPAEETVHPYMGDLDGLESLLDREVVDEVIIIRSTADLTLSSSDLGAEGEDEMSANQRWGRILELCLERGRTVSLVDDITPPSNAKVQATMIGTLPTLVLHNTPQNTLGLAVKSGMDRLIALIALIALSPLFLFIAIGIKITAPGPVFFRQKRVGLNGRQFWFYKFRSMVVNAEEILEKHRAEWEQHNQMSGGFWKWEDDPRITPFGKMLRKYSLDELPQFYNVLKGEMSLVGPRPPLPKEVDQLESWQRRKLSVKGGLTCLWQVSGRNEIDTDEWMRLDLEYIDNWSLWLDAKLLLKTLKVLIRPKGAS